MLNDVLQDSLKLKYRTFWPRFWAGVLDGIIFLPISFSLGWRESNS